MAGTDGASRRSAGARRAGDGLAIGFSAVLLVIVNGWPGWQAIPFLTSDTGQVLWLVNLSLAAGIAANLVYLARDPPWVRSLGDLVTTGIGLAAAIRIRRVFPFDVSFGWSAAVRVLLAVAIAGLPGDSRMAVGRAKGPLPGHWALASSAEGRARPVWRRHERPGHRRALRPWPAACLRGPVCGRVQGRR